MSRRVTLASVAGIVACVVVGLLIWRVLPTRRPAETVVVTVVHQGSPQDNEQAITIPIEAALANLEGLERLRSESRASTVLVACSFAPGIDSLDAAQRVRESLVAARMTLPPDADVPLVTRATVDPAPLWLIGDARTRERVERLPGVASVEACGDTRDQLRVQVDPQRLAATGVELAAVLRAVETTARPDRLPPRGRGEIPDRDRLAGAAIGAAVPPIKLSDVATLVAERVSTGCEARGLAEREVLARITLQQGAQRAAVTTAVEAEIREAGAAGRWLAPGRTLVIAVATPHEGIRDVAARLIATVGGAPGVMGVLVTSHASRDDVLELLITLDGSAAKALVPDLRQRMARDLPGVTWRGVRASPFAPPPVLTVTLRNDGGEAPEAFAARAREVEARLAAVVGIGTAERHDAALAPVLDITVDRQLAAAAAVAPSEVLQLVRAASGGIDVDGVLVRIGDEESVRAESLMGPGLVVRRVPLSSLVTVSARPQPAAILRIDARQAIELRWETEPELSKSAVERALTGTGAQIALAAR